MTRHRETSLRQRQQDAAKCAYSDEFYTPPALVAALGPFDLDPCAGPCHHAIVNYRLPEADGLQLPWHGRVWLNPPYSAVQPWLDRFTAHANGLVLVNARPDAVWFQQLAARAHAILFPRGRIQFNLPDGTTKHPPVGIALIAYGRQNAARLDLAELPGLRVRLRA